MVRICIISAHKIKGQGYSVDFIAWGGREWRMITDLRGIIHLEKTLLQRRWEINPSLSDGHWNACQPGNIHF